MAEPSEGGDYVKVTGATIWWKADTPDQIHLTFDDPDFTHPNTQPGMRVVFSSNPNSANYHPANFNRCRAVLSKYGKSAPPDEAEEKDRRLDKR